MTYKIGTVNVIRYVNRAVLMSKLTSISHTRIREAVSTHEYPEVFFQTFYAIVMRISGFLQCLAPTEF